MVADLGNNLRRGEKTGTHSINFIQAMQDVFSMSLQVLQSLRLSSAQGSCCSLKWAYSFQDFSGIISSVLCHVINSFQPQKLCWEISAEVTIRLKLPVGWAASLSFSQARNCLNQKWPILKFHPFLGVIHFFMREQSSPTQRSGSKQHHQKCHPSWWMCGGTV